MTTSSLEMSEELKQVSRLLSDECVWLHIQWIEYVELFGTNEARIELLNEAAALTRN